MAVHHVKKVEIEAVIVGVGVGWNRITGVRSPVAVKSGRCLDDFHHAPLVKRHLRLRDGRSLDGYVLAVRQIEAISVIWNCHDQGDAVGANHRVLPFAQLEGWLAGGG